MKTLGGLFLFWIALGFGARGLGVTYSESEFHGKTYTVCQVDIQKEKLELFLGPLDTPFKSFAILSRWLADEAQPQKRKLIFAMNAGMFHDWNHPRPVGLFINNGQQISPLNTATEVGYFFAKPNGVFVLTDKGAQVVETSKFPLLTDKVILATQSGPLLVENGNFNPICAKNKPPYMMNGVGITEHGEVLFAISRSPVTFLEFATFFQDKKDGLNCPNALYLDGNISGLYTGDPKRDINGGPLGTIIGIAQ